MGIYYGEAIGIRILRRLHSHAEYSEDYEVLWEYEGPYWRIFAKAKLAELELDYDIFIQTKHETTTTYEGPQKTYVWLTHVGEL